MQDSRLSFGVYRRPRDAGALNARRSFSHLTARNSKKRSSGVKGGRGAEGGRYASGVNRVVQTGAETVFLRAHLNSSDRMLSEILFRALLFFLPLSPVTLHEGSRAVSRKTTNAFDCVNFRRISREYECPYMRHDFRSIEERTFIQAHFNSIFFSNTHICDTILILIAIETM